LSKPEAGDRKWAQGGSPRANGPGFKPGAQIMNDEETTCLSRPQFEAVKEQLRNKKAVGENRTELSLGGPQRYKKGDGAASTQPV